MKTILYLGTDPTEFEANGHSSGHLIHYPVIKIIPRPNDHPEIKMAYDDLKDYTHLLFTSKNAVQVFFGHLNTFEFLRKKTVIAIGEVTAAHLSARGLPAHFVASQETQEGVVQLLKRMDLDDAYFFMPRSSLSRPVLTNFFKEREIRFQACDLYDTVAQEISPKPDLTHVDEIIFTSPSTVHAFLKIYGVLPQKKLVAIGSVTEQTLIDSREEEKNADNFTCYNVSF